ncbi:MAG: hypothetical protein HOI61_04015 [Gammaproteobacteria bacterium]|nr:hypothetical protein [Gammaproteobacteria bacterium]MBT3846189.1 hypothetical protein [Gammaproteobacteria bacterium]MBT3894114.1 hypothetical protein [Gammaproteobacteria bacterium]MBT4300452.1 hypothetical protein [Gammaproteobacteria bacterium]MBT5687662.1 hypothetical protein [Gammaproteobacteria bacterium]
MGSFAITSPEREFSVFSAVKDEVDPDCEPTYVRAWKKEVKTLFLSLPVGERTPDIICEKIKNSSPSETCFVSISRGTYDFVWKTKETSKKLSVGGRKFTELITELHKWYG